MGARDRFRFRPAVGLELGPGAGKADQRPIVVDCEPDDVLFLGLRVRLVGIFSEAIERHPSGFPASASRANAVKMCCGCWSPVGPLSAVAAASPSASVPARGCRWCCG
jgi:hypothetical protein